jgi:hypothetical protein
MPILSLASPACALGRPPGGAHTGEGNACDVPIQLLWVFKVLRRGAGKACRAVLANGNGAGRNVLLTTIA